MGAAVQPNQNSEEIDVTEFVRLGLLKPVRFGHMGLLLNSLSVQTA